MEFRKEYRSSYFVSLSWGVFFPPQRETYRQFCWSMLLLLLYLQLLMLMLPGALILVAMSALIWWREDGAVGDAANVNHCDQDMATRMPIETYRDNGDDEDVDVDDCVEEEEEEEEIRRTRSKTRYSQPNLYATIPSEKTDARSSWFSGQCIVGRWSRRSICSAAKALEPQSARSGR